MKPNHETLARQTMKAYIYRKYGGPEVVHLEEVPKPVPKDNEVLIKIHATSVTAADWRVRTLDVPRGFGVPARLALGVTGPRRPILGTELAGVVEAVGKTVTRYKPGDALIAFPSAKLGCHAEYRVMPEDGPLAPKPEKLSFEEAAAISFGGTTALYFLRKAGVKPGDHVLVIGASGGVGTALVQLAKHFGARVTGVTSTRNVQLVTSLGAGRVIDYTQEDFTKRSDTYDIIANAAGTPTFAECKHNLKEKGRYLMILGSLPEILSSAWAPLTGSKRVIGGSAAGTAEEVRELADLADSGALRPVIDKRYDFAQMRDAHAYVATGRKRGSVVVTVAPPE